MIYFVSRLRISNGTHEIIDSGKIIDKTYKGGRVGVMVFSQAQVIWSNVVWQCNNGKILYQRYLRNPKGPSLYTEQERFASLYI